MARVLEPLEEGVKRKVLPLQPYVQLADRLSERPEEQEGEPGDAPGEEVEALMPPACA
jgi:hypothetical protein